MILKANWPAPKTVFAGTSLRTPGFSTGSFASNNMGLHVGDEVSAGLKNRAHLMQSLELKQEPLWLNQVHSNTCITAETDTERTADAAVTRQPDCPLVIMTADCLPITLCNTRGDEVAAIHAGWRGLAAGIIENTLQKMQTEPEQLMAWIGPAICKHCFETGEEVYEVFKTSYAFSERYFERQGNKWHADLAKIAAAVMQKQGIKCIYFSDKCTFEANSSFYSYRKCAQSGRMATLIWFNHIKQDI